MSFTRPPQARDGRHGLLVRSGSREPSPQQRSHFRHAHTHVRLWTPSTLAAKTRVARDRHRRDWRSLQLLCAPQARTSRDAALRVECASRWEACRDGRLDRAGQRRAAPTPSASPSGERGCESSHLAHTLCCTTQKWGAVVFVDEFPGSRAPDRAFPPRLAFDRACRLSMPDLPARARSSRTSVRERVPKRACKPFSQVHACVIYQRP